MTRLPVRAIKVFTYQGNIQYMKKGAALTYNGEIPVITATARGILVRKLLEIAEKHDIPVYKDKDLVEVLEKLPRGEEIPPELYRGVAEVLAACYHTNKKLQAKINKMRPADT